MTANKTKLIAGERAADKTAYELISRGLKKPYALFGAVKMQKSAKTILRQSLKNTGVTAVFADSDNRISAESIASAVTANGCDSLIVCGGYDLIAACAKAVSLLKDRAESEDNGNKPPYGTIYPLISFDVFESTQVGAGLKCASPDVVIIDKRLSESRGYQECAKRRNYLLARAIAMARSADDFTVPYIAAAINILTEMRIAKAKTARANTDNVYLLIQAAAFLSSADVNKGSLFGIIDAVSRECGKDFETIAPIIIAASESSASSVGKIAEVNMILTAMRHKGVVFDIFAYLRECLAESPHSDTLGSSGAESESRALNALSTDDGREAELIFAALKKAENKSALK